MNAPRSTTPRWNSTTGLPVTGLALLLSWSPIGLRGSSAEARSPLPSDDVKSAVPVSACALPDLTLVERALARAYAGTLLLHATVTDELTSTGALPPMDEYDTGSLSNTLNPLLRIYASQLQGARREAESAVMTSVACFEAGDLPGGDVTPVAEAEILLGVANMIVADGFEDFRTAPGDPPLGPAGVRSLYDAAIVNLDSGIAFAASAGAANLVTRATALKARVRYAAAAWDVRHGPPITGWTAIFNAAAVTDGVAVLGSVPSDWSWGLTSPFELWPDLVPADTYASLDGAGNLLAQVLDPISGTPSPRLQQLLDQYFLDTSEPKSLPLVSAHELLLIRGESDLAGGDVAGAVDRVNQLRASVGLPAYVGGTPSEIGEMIRHHRRTELFLTLGRLSDLYRSVDTSPEWTGPPPSTLLPLWDETEATAQDRLELQNLNGPLTAVTLLDGRAEWGCLRNEASFTVGGFDDLLPESAVNVLAGEECTSEVAVFSNRNRFELEPLSSWTTATGDAVSVSLGAPLQLPIVVWRLPADDDMVKQDVAEARSIFALNRLGVDLDVTFEDLAPWPTNDSGKLCGCPDDPPAPPELGCSSVSPPPDPGVLNVFYGEDAAFPSSGTYTDVRGFYCERTTASPQDLVYISKLGKTSPTLAHELVHALIRPDTDPLAGVPEHPNDAWGNVRIPGFGPDNLMWSYFTSTTLAEARDRLTLGQVYKANVDERSWLNLAMRDDGSGPVPVRDDPEATFPCQCRPDSDGPCPPLSTDLGTPPDVLRIGGWGAFNACDDRLEIPNPNIGSPDPPGEDWAVVLFGGQRPDGTCLSNEVRVSEPRGFSTNSALYVGNQDSVVGGSTCDSEYFVFSRTSQMVSGQFASPTPARNEIFSPSLGTLHALPVSYHFVSPVTSGEVIDKIMRLNELFALNRVGVDMGSFTFAMTLGLPGPDPCAPTSNFTSPAVNVYFTNTLPTEAGPPDTEGFTCGNGGDVFVYVRPTGSVTELAHQVGHAFGLEDLGPGDLDPRERFRNLMSAPSPDEDARTHLTVGQVFRMYWLGASWLHQSLGLASTRCETGSTDPCPYLGTDLERE